MAFGTTETSPVVEATRETDATIVTLLTTALVPTSEPARPRERVRDRVPYPEDWIEHAELAAGILRQLYHRKGLLGDVQRESGLLERLNVALAECALLLRALGGRLDANHSG